MVILKENNNFKKLTQKRGISLLTLIIMIVVIIILSAAVIQSLNNNKLISNAKVAKDAMTVEEEKELIQIAYTFGLMDNETVTEEEMKKELEKSAKVEITTNGKGIIRVKFLDTKNVYDVDNGNVVEIEVVDFEKIIADATSNPEKYRHPEQDSDIKDIGIGTDGKPVNMKLWKYTIINENEVALNQGYGSGYGAGYENDKIEEGKIVGKVPQYIKPDGEDKFYLVTSMDSTFGYCTNLEEAPEIPNSVTNMNFTFFECTSLVKAPEIPSSVTNMYWTFFECTSLVKAPEIPNSVTDMYGTFCGCTALVEAPEISNSVTDMEDTFNGCTDLQGTMVINANPARYTNCFKNAAQNEVGLVITGESTMIDTLIETKGSDASKITNGNT